MKRLKDAFDEGHVVLDLDASGMESAISSAVRRAVAAGMLQYSGRLLGGFTDDVRRRSVCYASDFRDGLTAKSLSLT